MYNGALEPEMGHCNSVYVIVMSDNVHKQWFELWCAYRKPAPKWRSDDGMAVVYGHRLRRDAEAWCAFIRETIAAKTGERALEEHCYVDRLPTDLI